MVADVVRLHRARERQRRGLTILEGRHLVDAALESDAVVTAIFGLPDDATAGRAAAVGGIRFHAVTPAVLSRIAPTKHPKGPVALLEIPESASLSGRDTLVLESVTDPGNAGTLIRSAAAFGFQLAVTGEGADVWSPKVLRAGAGAHFDIDVSDLGPDPLAALREAGLSVLAAVPRGGASEEDISAGPVALLIGSEPRGLDPALIEAADRTVTIATADTVESLNAAVAGSILMHEIVRSRGRDM
jgi:TrmH family RNA methyltransferase